jgi:hypothetical protein
VGILAAVVVQDITVAAVEANKRLGQVAVAVAVLDILAV